MKEYEFDIGKLIEFAKTMGIIIEPEFDEREIIERIISVLTLEVEPKYSGKFRDYYFVGEEGFLEFISLSNISRRDFCTEINKYKKEIQKINKEYITFSRRLYYKKYKLMRKMLEEFGVFGKQI